MTSLRGLAQRKLRAFVTTLAVFLGVAFIAGSYVLTDTINASFDDIFDEAYAGTDVVGQPQHARPGRRRLACRRFPAELLERVRRVEGVESAEGGIFSLGRFVDEEGDQLTTGFAPNFISSVVPEPFETLTYARGPPAARRGRGLDRHQHGRLARSSRSATRCASPASARWRSTRSSASSAWVTPTAAAPAPPR